MQKIKTGVLSVLVALGILVALAMPAQALTTWYTSRIYCDWVWVYLHYDYNWYEEVFEGKRDKDVYQYRYYQYNWACHNLVPY